MRRSFFNLDGFTSGHLGLTSWGVSAVCHLALGAGLFLGGLWIIQDATLAGSASVVSLQLQIVQPEPDFEPPDVPIVPILERPESDRPLEAIESELARDQDRFEAVTPPKLPPTELAVVADTLASVVSKPKRPAETALARSSLSPAPPQRRVHSRRPTPPVPKVDATAIGFDDTTPARPLDNPRPEYPQEALRRGIEGKLVLRLTISAGGSVSRVEVAESSGFRILDEAAVSAVRQWSFVPARRGGRPVSWSARLPVRFHRS